MPRLKAGWLIFTGAVLTALPLGAVTTQSARLAQGEHLTLPVKVTALGKDKLIPVLEIETNFRKINTENLSGDNLYEKGNTAYLFLKRSGNVWYSYAVLNSLPSGHKLPDGSVMLRAKVTSVDAPYLDLAYSFNKISPQQSFINALESSQNQVIHIGLAVSPDGRSSVAALYAGEQRFAQRVNFKSVLPGRRTTSAAKAPPT